MKRTLLDNDTWLVTVGMLGGITVIHKARNIRIKATRSERVHLLEIFEELNANGVSVEPENEIITEIIQMFSEAIFSRNGVRWQAWFMQSPKEIARDSL